MKCLALIVLAACVVGNAVAVVPGFWNCNYACPYNYDPVCAVNRWGYRDTFPNHCTLAKHNCQNPYNSAYSLGIAETLNTGFADCNFPCARIYDPVCGVSKMSYRQTFPNYCTLAKQNCLDSLHYFRYIYRGECYPRYHYRR